MPSARSSSRARSWSASSGTQPIQELCEAGVSAVTCYKPEGDKIMRLNAQTGAMEGGFVHLPREAHWLADYLHEPVTFPRGRYDDQVDSTAQALAWYKQSQSNTGHIEYYRMLCEQAKCKLRAPIGISNVYTIAGQHVAVRDEMVEVSEENRGPLMAAGFTLINEE